MILNPSMKYINGVIFSSVDFFSVVEVKRLGPYTKQKGKPSISEKTCVVFLDCVILPTKNLISLFSCPASSCSLSRHLILKRAIEYTRSASSYNRNLENGSL